MIDNTDSHPLVRLRDPYMSVLNLSACQALGVISFHGQFKLTSAAPTRSILTPIYPGNRKYECSTKTNIVPRTQR